MIVAPIPINEEERLKRLKELKILDTAFEKSLDEVTALASEICETPIALISLVDENRQWFKSRVGLDASETPRDVAFCSHAILKDEIMEIVDSRQDERFHDNPLVTGDPHVIFYAGSPIQTTDHLALGTLCVIDNKPKKLNDFQKRTLGILSRQVSSQLELRRSLDVLAESKSLEAVMALVATYSHEINNPLCIAKGVLFKSKKEIPEEILHKLEHPLNRIQSAVEKIAGTLERNGIRFETYAGEEKMIKYD